MEGTFCSEVDGPSRQRQRRRQLARERLINYVQDVLRRQDMPLHDVIRNEVLPYLPATALLRFRAVCQSWRGHISTPFFEHRQSNTHRSLSGFFLCHPDDGIRTLYLPFHPTSAYNLPYPDSLDFLRPDGYESSHTAHALASSYGLVLAVISSERTFRRILWRPAYAVSNPTTSQWTQLPECPESFHDGVALLFEPSSINFYADYLVVSTFRVRDENQDPPTDYRKFVVFCSRAEEWRPVSKQTLPGKDTALSSPHGVAAGGKAYWRMAEGRIVSYEPGADASRVLDAPPEASVDGASVWQLGELKGQLYCVSYDIAQGALHVSTLVCGGRTPNSHWEKLRTIDIVTLSEVRPLMFQGSDGEVVAWVEGAVVAYKVATGKGRVLCEVPVAEFEFFPYISSLVSVKRITATAPVALEMSRRETSTRMWCI